MNRKEPLFRVVKRESSSPVRQALAYVAAVVIALLIGAALLSSMDVDPLTFYQKMVTMGIPGNKFPWRIVENFVKLFVPLLITSLALSLAFRMRFWNIGGEGQFIMGAICAAAAAHKLGPVLPQPLVVLAIGVKRFNFDMLLRALCGSISSAAMVMALCGILGGGLYGLIVALLKVRYNTNETLLTLMLNYIALYLLQFLGETKAGWNFFLDPDSARPKFAGFPDNADMITFPLGPFNLNLSLIIAIVLCVLLFGYLKYTKHGYEIAVVGDSPNTARYAGMKVGRIVVRTIFLSAALIGLAGAFYVSSAGTLSTSVTNDVGWTGIVVAWLAKLNTVGIVITALLITVLQFGCQAASTTYSSIDANFADLIQGIILFAVLAADFFTRFRLARRAAAPKEVSK